MKRLVIDAFAFEHGKSFGYQEFLFNLLDYFYSCREQILFEEIIIVCIDSQKDYFRKYTDKFSLKTYRCSNKLYRMICQSFFSINLNLRKQDLILYTANYSSLFVISKNILVIHDLLFKKKSLFPYPLMRIQRMLYLPISVRIANSIIAISNFTAHDIGHYYPLSLNKINVIYNYFNFKKYHLSLNSLEYKKNGNYFISVCSNAIHKNTLTVFQAFELYCRMDGKFNLILVGSLNKNTELYSFFYLLPSSIKERIFIYSKISNDYLAELYHNAHAYISASFFEGLGMPIVEAMYFNLPVILSDLPIMHEVSMERGIYFNPYNSKALAEIMLSVQSKKENVDYRKNVEEVFSEQNTSQKYVELINSFYK